MAGRKTVLQDGELRLRPPRLPEDVEAALRWYGDPDVLHGSEGPYTPPYDRATIVRMYEYLAREGELYIVEVEQAAGWRPIEDATLLAEDVPIVIGEVAYRSQGLGRRVLRLLLGRARELGWETCKARVFTYNARALRLFEGAGFRRTGTGVHAGQEVWRLELRLAED